MIFVSFGRVKIVTMSWVSLKEIQWSTPTVVHNFPFESTYAYLIDMYNFRGRLTYLYVLVAPQCFQKVDMFRILVCFMILYMYRCKLRMHKQLTKMGA